MQVLLLLRRPPTDAVLCLIMQMLAALSAQGQSVVGIFLFGPAVSLVQTKSTLQAKLVALAQAQHLPVYCCGRAAGEHGIDVNTLEDPFIPAGYFQLLHELKRCARVVEL
ncbi:MAG: DsrE family protein [Candidatus Anaerobiospirillum merdipullorum]|uniref:DsrE family protein n=1 Tax=Candidatus Anaerobiospirillum merdipullorum TaxID=2838450 RepID=A0A9E2NS60_9GAMM|nr:DsrE family protein [Candidatus Anaerobiospirillum merdipullorum]